MIKKVVGTFDVLEDVEKRGYLKLYLFGSIFNFSPPNCLS
jgi:hypothetical protein